MATQETPEESSNQEHMDVSHQANHPELRSYPATNRSAQATPLETIIGAPRIYGDSYISGEAPVQLGDVYSIASSSSLKSQRTKIVFENGYDPRALEQVMQQLSDRNIDADVEINIRSSAPSGEQTPSFAAIKRIPGDDTETLQRYLRDNASYATSSERTEAVDDSERDTNSLFPPGLPVRHPPSIASYGTLESLDQAQSQASTNRPVDDGRRRCQQEVLVEGSPRLKRPYRTVAILDTGATGDHPNLASRRFIEENLDLKVSDPEVSTIRLPGYNDIQTCGRIELKFWPLIKDDETNRLHRGASVRFTFNVVDDTTRRERPIFQGDLLLGTGYCKYMDELGFSLYTMSILVKKKPPPAQQVEDVQKHREELKRKAKEKARNPQPSQLTPSASATAIATQAATSQSPALTPGAGNNPGPASSTGTSTPVQQPQSPAPAASTTNTATTSN